MDIFSKNGRKFIKSDSASAVALSESETSPSKVMVLDQISLIKLFIKLTLVRNSLCALCIPQNIVQSILHLDLN